ncbi:spermidine synthase [Nesterenkonia ebinurensis]|uniref:spermidine synthase n=1 Tax=Nesterenkonia ebinurensis TaxID=2608252 RepID=UPI00123D749B|nr:fused MFS/spermidine synthase [Nesterenkonia ebinurensis]
MELCTQLPATTRLSHSGRIAELTRDDLTDSGVVLCIGEPGEMTEQSHVEARDPGFLLHDYIRRIRSVITSLLPPEELELGAILHLGAGALTLPRWVEHQWPQAAQTVVDIEPELVGFVLEHLPMRRVPESVVADAAQVLTADGDLSGRRFEVVVVDLFNSSQAPDSLTELKFFQNVLGALTPGGLMVMNIGDDAGMEFARRLTGRLLEALGREGVSAHYALLTAPDTVLSGEDEGNLVFAARPSWPLRETETSQIWAAGPHPGDVLSGEDLHAWVS